MSNSPKILALAGSARKGSFNVRLLRIAADAVRRSGGDVTLVDLRDYPLPLYDGDLEADEGVPDKAVKLAQLMLDHDALLIASPEYNSSITPLLKNTIDWVSRPSKNIPGLAAFKGKVAALMSASPGALGGLRGLVHVRSILGNIGVIVLPDQVAIPQAEDAFNEEGQFRDEKNRSKVASLAKSLVEATRKLK
jgi:chromate reductase, NAD(P)H dehydrogenase (quinone)